MAATGVFFLTVSNDFYIFRGPRGKVIIGKVLSFAGYVHHYKSLPRNIFGLILKNKMATMSFLPHSP